MLLPAGTLTGTLVESDGVTPVGANVEVTLAEAATPTVVTRRERTDESGRWRFELVAPGPYVIEAADLSGNRARAVATAVAGTESNIPLAYLGRGTVSGIVRTAAGQPVVGATVELFATSLFGSAPMQTRTSGDDGRFTFPGVYVGDVTVRARDILNQGGVATGSLTQAGQQLDLTVSLAAFGTLQGTVFRQDGTTAVPAASVTVRMTSGAQFTATTQPDGTYRFEVLPFQGYTVTARETATRGVGVASGAFGASGETRTLDVVLLPQGSVLVQVIGADGQPVNGASVTVTTSGYGLQDARTGATTVVDGVAGRVLLDRMLEGSLTVNASAGGFSGSVTGLQVVRDTITNVQVTLEPQATIDGRVFEADGATPAGGTVTVYGANNFARGLAVVDGRFSTDLRLGTYALVAFDGAGRRRAIVQNIVLASNAQVESRDLVYVAVGTVSGRVIHPSVGGDAGGLSVQLQSLHPDFGGFRSTTTNAAGLYTIADVPYGVVRVSVAKSSESLQGESAGLLQAPTLSLDVLLQNNSVTLPVTLNDVNDSTYSIISGGRLGGGTRSVFSAGASALEIERDGARTAFTGTTFATRELGGRQLVVREQGLHGLSVTRKAYVPVNGYFARYLEVLANPTEAPIVVNVHLTSWVFGWPTQFGGFVHHQVSKTSSDDAVLDPGVDRWVTLDGFGLDGYYSSAGSSRVSVVFDGEGGAEAADTLQFSPGASNYSSGKLALGWQSLTIPAGGQVSLLHFTGQQPSPAAAIASADRISSLPPEALEGLTAADLASVVNFAVPADGLSQVPALPPVSGAVSGRVFEGDGTTPVQGAQVRFRSSSPVHGREWFVSSAADGSFSFTGVPLRPVPVTDVQPRRPPSAEHPVRRVADGDRDVRRGDAVLDHRRGLHQHGYPPRDGAQQRRAGQRRDGGVRLLRHAPEQRCRRGGVPRRPGRPEHHPARVRHASAGHRALARPVDDDDSGRCHDGAGPPRRAHRCRHGPADRRRRRAAAQSLGHVARRCHRQHLPAIHDHRLVGPLHAARRASGHRCACGPPIRPPASRPRSCRPCWSTRSPTWSCATSATAPSRPPCFAPTARRSPGCACRSPAPRSRARRSRPTRPASPS